MKSTYNVCSNDRGGALAIVSLLLAVFSISSGVYLTMASDSFEQLSFYQQRNRTFYVAEGVRHITVKLIQEFMNMNPEAGEDEIEAMLKNDLPQYVPDRFGHKLELINMKVLSSKEEATPLSSGPYAGMLASQKVISLEIGIVSESESGERGAMERINIQVALADIAMYQFLMFADLDYFDLLPGPTMEVNGWTHINGDFCAAGGSGLYFSKVTVAGRMMLHKDERCRYEGKYDYVYIAKDSSFSSFEQLQEYGDHGCENCDGSGLPWKVYARETFKGNLLDKAQDVTPLSLPVAKSATGQRGYKDGALTSNKGNSRFLIDPVLSTDAQEVKEMKYAYKADLRILDGVWYIKNPDNPDDWPGIKIWSDHPGGADEPSEIGQEQAEVGQDQIRTFWDSTAYKWPENDTPRNYSYYEYDADSGQIYEDETGVISYGGSVYNSPQRPLAPGLWFDGPSGASSPLCDDQSLKCSGSCGMFSALKNNLKCRNGKPPHLSTLLLNATRTGFRDAHIHVLSSGSKSEKIAKSTILPVNFDVEQFQQALQNKAAGELGSYFGPGRLHERDFNGIVYVSSSWPGSLDGFDDSVPESAPYQGNQNDPAQMAITGEAHQRALPYQLCSSSSSRAGQPYDKLGRFKVPSCEAYARSGSLKAFPNAVRVINGANIDNAVLPKGLSIVTNLPIYIAGDYNTSSNTDSATSTPWVPALIAGDWVSVLSNNWDDTRLSWAQEDLTDVSRKAADTTYNTAILSGWTQAEGTRAGHSFPSMIEAWSRRKKTLATSIVLGYYPVYRKVGNQHTKVYSAPKRIFSFDPHFHHLKNQPPGTPVYSVSATLYWKRR